MKYVTDIRSTSSDSRYFDSEGFTGTIDEAIAQAKARPDFGPGPGARNELLQFLRVPAQPKPQNTPTRWDQIFDQVETEQERDDLNVWIGKKDEQTESPLADNLSKYSLEYAIAKGWVVRVQAA